MERQGNSTGVLGRTGNGSEETETSTEQSGGKKRDPYLDEIYQILKMKSELWKRSDLYPGF